MVFQLIGMVEIEMDLSPSSRTLGIGLLGE